ncbi:MAG: cyclopropane-fatty-acyl-phospholipid synthase [Methyloligella sp.]|nr:MAG: cyclopropane-fatty-acyl-phospholipid synthase [Methyloligella sp.]
MLKKKTDVELADILAELVTEISQKLDVDMNIKLWDGRILPLGPNVTSDLTLVIAHPGVIASLLKGPSLDKIIRHYIHKNLDFEGGTLFDIGEQIVFNKSRKRIKEISKSTFLKKLAPFLLVPSLKPEDSRAYEGDEAGSTAAKKDAKKFIEFHYDVSNDFYKLFLDERMTYTCAYFTDWDNSLDQAQFDKLDMICKKLRLKEGETMLDIGCGWGGLLIHAAENYGVQAHGVTLATEQYEYAMKRIKEKGLEGKVKIELKDYRDLDEQFDKISSIGMYEHVGIDQVENYLSKVRSMLKPDGLFLNHGITRRGKKTKKRLFDRPEKRAIQKYIFPGGDLDSLGNTIANMEKCGFEVQDVEGWRMHYQKTTQEWCDRLTEHQDEAIALVGEETYRIWVVYLAGVSLTFLKGSMRLYQTLATQNPKGMPATPQTREDLYQ